LIYFTGVAANNNSKITAVHKIEYSTAQAEFLLRGRSGLILMQALAAGELTGGLDELAGGLDELTGGSDLAAHGLDSTTEPPA
jgi:X-X-X-Leu-X-X-Gly heptad repeat protein